MPIGAETPRRLTFGQGSRDSKDRRCGSQTAIDNISQGICFFGAEEQLILSNRCYAEIYRIAADELRPGLTLAQIVELRVAAGTSAMPADAYLAMARSVNSGNASSIWSAKLGDGRTIQICHQPMPDGGWVATHEDIAETHRQPPDR